MVSFTAYSVIDSSHAVIGGCYTWPARLQCIKITLYN
ncbi:MAG: hypothetical protein K0Q66_1848 [Chitinophagaceae bacterium]|nr:hypothetical protein [Chitinophagaceae bacterium]